MYFITNHNNKHGPYGSDNGKPYYSDVPDKYSVSIVNQNVLDQAIDYVLCGSHRMSNHCTLPTTLNFFGFYVSIYLSQVHYQLCHRLTILSQKEQYTL